MRIQVGPLPNDMSKGMYSDLVVSILSHTIRLYTTSRQKHVCTHLCKLAGKEIPYCASCIMLNRKCSSGDQLSRKLSHFHVPQLFVESMTEETKLSQVQIVVESSC